ncbi:MAG TPA: TonB-dependent receptor [Burkholderiales bacterium]|nr:TonB-dependent receptor [Burkholderiales bacterium]
MKTRGVGLPALGIAAVLFGAAGGGLAQTSGSERSGDAAMRGLTIDRIVVTGSKEQAQEVAGSVHFLDEVVLEQQAYGDVNRVLRQVPGVNIVEEEGFGLRPNIGIRGSGTDRNSKIAVMEDGVPIAPAPYSAPAAYYFPRTPRIHAVEVTKGPAAIKYGPQTVAGAVNLFSTPIPEKPGGGLGGGVNLFGGDFSTMRGHGLVGGFIETGKAFDIGMSFETLQEHSDGFKKLDSGGSTGYRIEDYVAKLAFRSAEGESLRQSLEFKFQTSDEVSDETYLGLALDDFRADPYRRYRGSQLDQMNVQHQTYQATHRIDLSDRLDLTTTAYYTKTKRAWYKLNDVRNAANTAFVSLSNILADPATFSTEYAALVGAPGATSAAGALRVRNNNREYYGAGIQSVLGVGFDMGQTRHQLEMSLRYHQDEEDRFQQDDRYTMTNGTMVLSTAGAPGSQANRIGEAKAWAAYVRDTIEWNRWTFVPGVRYENISLKRTDYGSADPSRTGPTTVRENTVDVFLPGFGTTYDLTEEWKLVGGVHRGFVNPSPGSDADAEDSWNYEAGVRFNRGYSRFEAIGFLVDYQNLVGTCTASTGGGCNIGDQFDGGKGRVYGLELVAGYDAGERLGLEWSVPLSAVYTYTQGEFRTSFVSSFEEWGNVAAGDELPLLPEHQLTLNAGLEGYTWRTFLTMNYVGEARARAGTGAIPENQRIDSRTIFDVSGEVDMTRDASLFASVHNLTDEVYNVGFRPAGARPGMPRTFMAGLKVKF